MPDVLTHAAAGYLIGRKIPQRPYGSLLVFGAVLPDLVTRVPEIVLQRFLGFPVGHFFSAFHTPAALILICYLISFAFENINRKKSFLFLLFGTFIHFVMDLMQAQLHNGLYMPLFPFSFETIQWKLFGIHDSLFASPVLAALIVWFWIKDYRQSATRDVSPSTSKNK
jgi:hypothetical protein